MRPKNRTRSLALLTLLSAALLASPAAGQAVDPGAAREQLKQGFALKQQGKFAEALPHLLESLRLDPQVKTLMNLADTEEHVAKLVDAAQHWVLARDKAAAAGDTAARAEAAKRLTALEARMPRLTIVLKGDPGKATVKRDGVLLGAVSLGTALPSDPGGHVILVEADGHASRTFEVTLAEGEKKTVEVTVGAKAAATTSPPTTAPPPVSPPPPASASPPVATAPPPAPESAPAPPTETPAAGRTQRIAGFATAGVGVLALGFATIEYLSAKSKHTEALGHCTASSCDETAFSLQDDARSASKVGNVSAIIGGLLVVVGGVLVFTAPRGSASATGATVTTRITLTPSFGRDSRGLSLTGAF